MITDEMTAWLGPAADEMTPEQLDRFARVWQAIADRYTDEPDLSSDVLSATAQYLLGETTLSAAASRLTAARIAQRTAMEVGKQIALMAIEDGMDEQDAAKHLGVNRTTLRRAAGKQ